jgi:hypothetical protein
LGNEDCDLVQSFDFTIAFQHEGTMMTRSFVLTMASLTAAVNKAMSGIRRDNPAANFIGLTYFHPPL